MRSCHIRFKHAVFCFSHYFFISLTLLGSPNNKKGRKSFAFEGLHQNKNPCITGLTIHRNSENACVNRKCKYALIHASILCITDDDDDEGDLMLPIILSGKAWHEVSSFLNWFCKVIVN
jgi:hypothetical protein